MIYYFSATGNSRWVARQLAKRTNDIAVSITKTVKAGKKPLPIGEGEVLGIVFPVYAWSVPKYVTDFVKKMKIDKKAYVYAVATCESEVGAAFLWLKSILHINSYFRITMPNNYVMWGYSANNEKHHRRIIAESEMELNKVANDVLLKRNVKHLPIEGLRIFKSCLIAPLFRLTRSDRAFSVDEKCVGCSKCVAVCPISNILLENGNPKWKHGNCMHCTACINQCPQKAIQYGNATQDGERYVFPDYLI